MQYGEGSTDSRATPRADRWGREGALRKGVLALLIVSALAGVAALVALVRSQKDVTEAVNVIMTSDALLSTLKDLETGSRGYLLSPNETYLGPYNAAIEELPYRLKAFRDSVGDDPNFVSDADHIEHATAGKRAFASEVVRLQKAGDTQAAIAKFGTGDGRRLMDEARIAVATIQMVAQGVIDNYQRNLAWPLSIAVFLSFALTVLATGFFVASANRSRTANMRSARLLNDLIGRAPVGVAILNERRAIAQSNPAFRAMSGVSRESQVRGSLQTVAPALYAPLSDTISSALAGFRSTWKSQPEIVVDLAHDGALTHLNVIAFPVTLEDDDGRDAPGVALMVNDISRQRLWEIELEAAYIARSGLMDLVS